MRRHQHDRLLRDRRRDLVQVRHFRARVDEHRLVVPFDEVHALVRHHVAAADPCVLVDLPEHHVNPKRTQFNSHAMPDRFVARGRWWRGGEAVRWTNERRDKMSGGCLLATQLSKI